MRGFCTVSAPLEVCAPPSTKSLTPGLRFLALRILGKQPHTLYFHVEAKSRVREVYAQTCLHFLKQGMQDTELFGLAVMIDGEYLFIEPDSKLSKYGPKNWRSSHTHGLDANGRPLLELHFRVQFYIESPLMLRDETSLHNYYLQLKINAINRNIPNDCIEQSLLLLGGLALQADTGDFPSQTDDLQIPDYFNIHDYLPNILATTLNVKTLYLCHREYQGMTRRDAEIHYIREACTMQEFINSHIFHMKITKNEPGIGTATLIVYSKGVRITGDEIQTTTFLWANITKLSFERKKFEIRSGDHKVTLYSNSDEKNKMILALCRETHQFSMKIASRLHDAIRREDEETSMHSAGFLNSRSLRLAYKNKNDQRVSVISSTSSNTTSGIVSDRVHSEDELEIIINTPPVLPVATAPSTESLALIHLLDKCQASTTGQLPLTDLEVGLKGFSSRPTVPATTLGVLKTPTSLNRHQIRKEPDSPNSQHHIGSQSSSTCSTVVVTSEVVSFDTSSHVIPLHKKSLNHERHISTSSSLELGFSHTAQNSTISEITKSSDKNNLQNDEENSSIVYDTRNLALTETSGVYTIGSSELTENISEIAESETDQETKEYNNGNVDLVDGGFRESNSSNYRLLSNSTISIPESFRGDGTDPTNKRLLSVEELTDLIVVGCRQEQPSLLCDKSESECEYVTLSRPSNPTHYYNESDNILPVTPPKPPKRIESISSPVLPPPPYNSRHETTGVCGPAPNLPLEKKSNCHRNQSYQQQLNNVPVQNVPPPKSAMPMLKPVEASARFITTRPNINILSAHTQMVGEAVKSSKSYMPPPINNIHSKSQIQLSTASNFDIPLVSYNMHSAHTNTRSTVALPPPPPPYPEMQQASRACVLLPVRKYLPPPPPTMPRQPPPPPPTQLGTVYTSQLARSQIELYRQQMYSDVDYVIYPLQDPAVSQQEYLDSKQGSILAAMAQNPQPSSYLGSSQYGSTSNSTWDMAKNHALYRSTPYLPMSLPMHTRYASTQNLSDTYVQLPSTYSPSVTSLCSSYEPPPPQQPIGFLHGLNANVVPNHIFYRSKSDDNILNSIDGTTKLRRMPPPPPPQYERNRRFKPPIPTPDEIQPPNYDRKEVIHQRPLTQDKSYHSFNHSNVNRQKDHQHQQQIGHSESDLTALITKQLCQEKITVPQNVDAAMDINALREKTKYMDLPLLAALCNDRTLLKQTKVFGPSNKLYPNSTISSLKAKYPVSGLKNSVSKSKQWNKSTISHRHPNDKLPPLPVQTVEGNNYVKDPTPALNKHKNTTSHNSS